LSQPILAELEGFEKLRLQDLVRVNGSICASGHQVLLVVVADLGIERVVLLRGQRVHGLDPALPQNLDERRCLASKDRRSRASLSPLRLRCQADGSGCPSRGAVPE
jgi:hypothetical protein